MPLPAWWSRERQRRNARTRERETLIAREQGGRPTPGSGSSWRSPGDVKLETHLVEEKWTDKGSYSLSRADLEKHWERALLVGREPVLIIEFLAPTPLRVAVVPYEGA